MRLAEAYLDFYCFVCICRHRLLHSINGNNFVAVIEFGKTLKAKTILTGGASTDSTLPHFTDQVKGYINGQFKEIFFYKKDVMNNAEKTYRPGE